MARIDRQVSGAYAFTRCPSWATGFDIPHPSAQALYEAPFSRLPFYGGCLGGSSERRPSERYVNPVASATLSRLTSAGGGSQLPGALP